MKLVLLAAGRMKSGPERELLQRYLDRAALAARGVGLTGVECLDFDESRAKTPDQRKRDEAADFAARLPAGVSAFLLDERGKSLASAAFAAEIGKARDAAVQAFALVVGGPDGFDAAFRASHRTLGFGAATFPHQLVRVLAAEQLYRAITILAGHPYHRA